MNWYACMQIGLLKAIKQLSTDFLGEEARFPLGPFILAATFKVPVSYVFA